MFDFVTQCFWCEEKEALFTRALLFNLHKNVFRMVRVIEK